MSDSLFAQPGDTIYASRERMTTFGIYRTLCISVKSDSIFGVLTELKEFFDQSFIPGSNYMLAKGFGELYGSVCEMGCGYSSLQYAKINGKEYGKKITSINSDDNFSPSLFILDQNYPNPFNPTTVISFRLSVNSKVSLKVYDVLGKEVAVLVNEEKQSGNYKINFDAHKLASGIYFYSLHANNFVQNRKMILLK